MDFIKDGPFTLRLYGGPEFKDGLIMRVGVIPSAALTQDRQPGVMVEITCDEPNNIRVRSVYIAEFDPDTYNWLGLLRAILSELREDEFKNEAWAGEPMSADPPRTRWLPPLGESMRGILRRQLGR